MSAGTSSDPIIVESWAEFEEYNTVDNIGTYIQFKNNSQNNQKYDHIHQVTQQLVLFINGFMKASGFPLGPHNFLQNFLVVCNLSEMSTCQKSFL